MSNTRFEVLALTRELLLTLGIREENVASLTDADMEMIAHTVGTQYQRDFPEQVRFITSVYLVEKEWHTSENPKRTDGEDQAL